MKCFKFIFVLLLVSFSTFADDYVVMPSQAVEESLKLGDILYVEVINKSGNKVFDGKRIGNLLYVLDKTDKNTFRVIVSPENTKNKKIEPNADTFELSGFKFEKGLDNYTQNFELDLKQYELEEASYKRYLIYLLIIFLSPFALKYFLIFLRKYEKKQKQRLKRKRLKTMILKAKTREELERVYQYKREIKEYLKIEEDNLEDFLREMNNIQYKKRWSEEDIGSISKVVSKFKKDVSGI